MPPSSSPSSSSPPSGSGPACSFRVCEDLLCSSDELRIFTEEGEEEERESGGVRHLQEELEAALFEEKTSLIRETELGLKQEGFFSRLEAGKSLKDNDMNIPLRPYFRPRVRCEVDMPIWFSQYALLLYIFVAYT